jgi:uncharacterized membrane protein
MVIRNKYPRLHLIARWIAKNPARIFLILALVFGCVFVFSLAPLNGTDEFTHFPRVYQISDGTFWEKRLPNNQFGGDLPTNINTMIDVYRNLSRESSGPQYQFDKSILNKRYSSVQQVGTTQHQASFTAVVLYPPWAYMPSVMGVIVAKIAHLPLIWYIYLGRLFTLLSWMILTWLAIKIIPEGKWFLVALALLPTSLSQAVTIGADGLINSISWLLIVLVLAMIAKTVSLTTKSLILITLLATSLSIIKQSYWPIALFPLIMPISYFKSVFIGRVWKSLLLIVVLATTIVYALKAKAAIAGIVLSPVRGMYIDASLQTQYLLHHIPLFIARALLQPLTKSFDTVYLGVFGIVTNRLIYLSILIIGLLALTVCVGVQQTKPIPSLIEHRTRLWITATMIVITTYLLIATAFYIGESPVGGSIINSLYGRYFLPLFPLILIAPLTLRRRIFNEVGMSLFMVSASTLALIATAGSIGQ